MKSWGHYIRALSDGEQKDYMLHAESYAKRYSAQTPERNLYLCSNRRCAEPVTHLTGYRYVTGRAGRVTTAERRVCAKHAEAFSEKYNIVLPDEPAPRPPRTEGYMMGDES